MMPWMEHPVQSMPPVIMPRSVNLERRAIPYDLTDDLSEHWHQRQKHQRKSIGARASDGKKAHTQIPRRGVTAKGWTLLRRNFVAEEP